MVEFVIPQAHTTFFKAIKSKPLDSVQDLQDVLTTLDSAYGIEGMHRMDLKVGAKYVYLKCHVHGCNWEFRLTYEVTYDGEVCNIGFYKQNGSKYHDTRAHERGIPRRFNWIFIIPKLMKRSLSKRGKQLNIVDEPDMIDLATQPQRSSGPISSSRGNTGGGILKKKTKEGPASPAFADNLSP